MTGEDRYSTRTMPLRERVASGLGAAATVALVGAALVYGLAVPIGPRQVQQALAVLDLAVPPPPQPPPEPPRPSRAAKKAPAPPNLRNRASVVVAPPPAVRLPPPPPTVVAAPIAGSGFAANTGASDRPGPGTGAGGVGDGTGGGGDGGGGGDDRGPVQVRGRLGYGDLPPGVRERGLTYRVGVRYYVNVDGRVSGCDAPRSSGDAGVDAAVCAAIERKFRFRPSRDPAGDPVRSIVVETHSFVIDRSEM